MSRDTLVVARAEAGILLVGPEGFPDIVLQNTINVVTEIKRRLNYIMPSPVPDTEEERKIIPFPAR